MDKEKATNIYSKYPDMKIVKFTSLFFVLALMSLPVSAEVAQVRKDKTSTVQDTQPTKKVTKLKRKRPLAISRLKTTGVSLTERIAMKRKFTVLKPKKTQYHKDLNRNIVIVKFVDGARVREENTSAARRKKTDRSTLTSRLDALKPQIVKLDRYDKDLLKRNKLTNKKLKRQMRRFRKLINARKLKHWKKVFDIDDNMLANFRINAEIRNKRQSSDLSNYYIFELNKTEQGEKLADRLNELDIVEIAYLMPIPKGADIPPTTPGYQNRQDYLNAAPVGIDAKYAWNVPGGKGALVKIIDIEKGWNLSHEDLPSMFIVDGHVKDSFEKREHGTAVMGVMLGLDDGIGVTGIVPEASGGIVSASRGLGLAPYDNIAEAVLVAAMNLSEGDVILIEQHSRGPGNAGDCTACTYDTKSCGFIAMEYWNDIFDAITAASSSGIIVVEAAGNGSMNLDHARYKDRFNRVVRNSGALLVGAGESDTRKPKCWSNHGSRVDVQGWGENVMTTGYGDTFKANGADINQWYTATFGGTSSATPIVAGAVAAIQGVQIKNNNPVLDWYEMAELLVSTGTPQTGGKNIGPLPDLKAALAKLEPPSPKDAVYEYVITMNETLLDADREVSGFKGARTRDIGEPAELGAIERIKFGERSDRPCYVQVEKADIVGNTILKPHAELDICGNKDPTDRSMVYVPLLTTSHDTFIHGVSVCNSKTNNSTRLKGAKLYRTRIEDDGSFTRLPNPAPPLDRPNCDNNWRTPAMCPSGSVATKLVAHIRDEGNNDVITGLSLKCKEVEVKRTCVSGC